MKYKVVAFDLDGTLTNNEESSWTIIHDYFGIDPEERMKAKNAYAVGEITYQQWVDHNINLWRKKGVTKDMLLQAVKGIKMTEGALETIQKLKNTHYKIAIISGSLNIVIEHVMRQHQMLFDHIFINKLAFGDGGKVVGAKATPYDMKNKAEGLKSIAEAEGVSLAQCVFVGDHGNDVEAAKIAGLSIAFMPKDSLLAESCKVVIQNNDLREILKYLE